MAKKTYSKIYTLLNKSTLLTALILAVCLITLVTGLGWYNNKVVIHTSNPIARYTAEPHNPLSFLSNWDGPNYINLAKHGYTAVGQSNFLPLYPILIRIVNEVIHSPLDSAILISWLCAVGAIYFYLKIVHEVFDIKSNLSATKAADFYILFPTAVFLVATYPSSLLAFTGFGGIYFAFKRQYLTSAAFCLFCAVANTDGVFALIAACLILLEQKVHPAKVLTTFIVGLLGLADYSLFLYQKFNKPLAFILTQKSHGWLNFHYDELIQTADFFNLVFVILLIVSIFYWWNRRRSFSVFSFLYLLIPLIGNQFGGFNRYVLFAIPLPLMAYDYLKNKLFAYSLVLAFMSIIWAYFVFQYAGGYVGG